MKKVIIIVAVVALIGGGVIASLYTKTWNPEWNPFRPVPEEVLSQMATKMGEVKTLHSKLDLDITVKEEEEFNIVISVFSDTDKTNPATPRIKGDINVEFSTEGMSTSLGLEFIEVGEDSYYKINKLPLFPALLPEEFNSVIDAIRNQWIKFDEESVEELIKSIGIEMEEEQIAEEGRKELTKELIKLFEGKKFYEVKEVLPDEKIAGQMTYHYLLSLNKDEVAKLIPELVGSVMKYGTESGEMFPVEGGDSREVEERIMTELQVFLDKMGEIPFEVWIGQKDYYLYKARAKKEIDLSEFEKGVTKLLISADINLSKFNEPIDITPPENYKDLEEIFHLIIMEMYEDNPDMIPGGMLLEGIEFPL